MTSPDDQAVVTCDGHGADPEAKIRYRGETLINAPLQTVWDLQTDVERWPSWQAAVTGCRRLDEGDLRVGSAFRWTTPVPETPLNPATSLVVVSTVEQLATGRCIRWTGAGTGEGVHIDMGVHVWTFTEVADGVLVRTEETWTGEQVEADVATSTAYLGYSLEAWLADLKTTAEGR
ncbi:SRPBCC family protein [Dactylosporangium sp. NPDC051541]|uniref:SRPBCC family protein n=1 Tax=Dactylosporangium sp. NPDC051541 TaxID=3363977 RepID=UPI0037A9D398